MTIFEQAQRQNGLWSTKDCRRWSVPQKRCRLSTPGSPLAIFIFSETPNKGSGNGIPTVLRYGPYVKTHRRHIIQQSEYTLCLVFDDEWRFEQYDTVFEGCHQQGVCRKFTIPAAERIKVLKELDEHNVNALSLFGSEESMMETLATREFCFGAKGDGLICPIFISQFEN